MEILLADQTDTAVVAAAAVVVVVVVDDVAVAAAAVVVADDNCNHSYFDCCVLIAETGFSLAVRSDCRIQAVETANEYDTALSAKAVLGALHLQLSLMTMMKNTCYPQAEATGTVSDRAPLTAPLVAVGIACFQCPCSVIVVVAAAAADSCETISAAAAAEIAELTNVEARLLDEAALESSFHAPQTGADHHHHYYYYYYYYCCCCCLRHSSRLGR